MKMIDFNKIKHAPKTELHCHLDGSVRVETLFELVLKEGLDIEEKDLDSFQERVKIKGDCDSLKEYLNKFVIPSMVMQTRENIKRITKELLEDASKDGIRYIEIRFAPLLHVNKGLSLEEVVEAVLDGVKEGEKEFNIIGRVILCCMRHMEPNDSKTIVELTNKYKDKGVVAVDLAGNEEDFPPELHKEAFHMAKEYGLNITIHAGETGIENNIVKSIDILGASRIGHGVYAYKNENIVNLLRERQIPLEICIKSNIDTKATESYKTHPIKEYLDKGLKVTLNTDNRTVSDISLTEEYYNLIENQHLSEEDAYSIIKNGINSIFESDSIKHKLSTELREVWDR